MQYLANIKLFEILGAQKPSKMMNSGAVFNADAICHNVKIINADLPTTFSVTGADYGSLAKANDHGTISTTANDFVNSSEFPINTAHASGKKKRKKSVRQTDEKIEQLLRELLAEKKAQRTTSAPAVPPKATYVSPQSPIHQWIKGFNTMAYKQTRAYFDHIWKVKYGKYEDTSQAWNSHYNAIEKIWQKTVGKAAKEFVRTFEEFWKFVQDTYENAYAAQKSNT